MDTDEDDPPVTPSAPDRESGEGGHRGEDQRLESGVSQWQRFKRAVGPVLEGGLIAAAVTAVAGASAVSIGGGVGFYTGTAFVLIALYLRYRL